MSSHLISYFGSCRAFVSSVTLSADFVGRRNVSSITRPGQLTVGFDFNSNSQLPGRAAEKTFQQPTRPSDNVTEVMKGLQEAAT